MGRPDVKEQMFSFHCPRLTLLCSCVISGSRHDDNTRILVAKDCSEAMDLIRASKVTLCTWFHNISNLNTFHERTRQEIIPYCGSVIRRWAMGSHSIHDQCHFMAADDPAHGSCTTT